MAFSIVLSIHPKTAPVDYAPCFLPLLRIQSYQRFKGVNHNKTLHAVPAANNSALLISNFPPHVTFLLHLLSSFSPAFGVASAVSGVSPRSKTGQSPRRQTTDSGFRVDNPRNITRFQHMRFLSVITVFQSSSCDAVNCDLTLFFFKLKYSWTRPYELAAYDLITPRIINCRRKYWFVFVWGKFELVVFAIGGCVVSITVRVVFACDIWWLPFRPVTLTVDWTLSIKTQSMWTQPANVRDWSRRIANS